MPASLEQRVLDLLCRLPRGGLATAHTLICDTLHYEPAGMCLTRAGWPEAARQALAADPLLLAATETDDGPFDVIYACVPVDRSGPRERLSREAQHLAAGALLQDHPHALLLFSDPGERRWELVSARPGDGCRPLLRHLAVGQGLGATARRVAMLDLASLPGYQQGTLSAARVAQRHAEAFDADALGREFLERFAALHERVRHEIAAALRPVDAGAHAQALLDRLLVLYFLQKGGWLEGGATFLHDRFVAHHAGAPGAFTYHREVIYPLTRALAGWLARAPGADLAPPRADLPVSNGTYAALLYELFEQYDLMLDQDTAFDQAVAIGPEMLGKVFESLVLSRERDGDVDRRRATGSYYTPRPVVAFMCREALAEYLAGEAGLARSRASRLLSLPPWGMMSEEEREWLAGAFSGAQTQHLRRALLSVRACDPAAGSGAFLIGLLQAISDAVEALDRCAAGEAAPIEAARRYDTRREIVERCLHGVDLQPGALRACALRLWLSLLAVCEPPGQAAPEGADDEGTALRIPAHLLPDLSRTLREGDGLLERLGNGYGVPFRWRDDFRGVFEEKG
ncbi:MAG TPA: hypothetical protein VLC95_05585, partial [Anaerolineae bacterium]|nr:hypothetical protein [Anaerolineae bacterium]